MRGAVRSRMPGDHAFAARKEITAATVRRLICTVAGRTRPGTCDQALGSDDHTSHIRERTRERAFARVRRRDDTVTFTGSRVATTNAGRSGPRAGLA